jgi:hypothetical protein
MSLGLRPPNLAELGADASVEVGAEGAKPN